MRRPLPPSELEPPQRRRELVELLAAAVLRRRQLLRLAGPPLPAARNLAESPSAGLEVRPATGLSVRAS